MTKVRTREECLNAIQADIAWRKKEVSLLMGLLDDRDPPEEEPLRRSAMVMIYAHWEGFVKQSSELYFTHINEILTRSKSPLNEHFNNLRMWKAFRQQGDHVFLKNPTPFLQMREGWPCAADELLPIDVIDTASNLNSVVLKRLCKAIDVPFALFESKANLIDEQLLKARNAIAHGDRHRVSYGELSTAHDEIMELLGKFQQAIEDCVDGQAYRAVP